MKGLHAVFLPVNKCWQTMFGDTPVSIGASDNSRILFDSRYALKEHLKSYGLELGKPLYDQSSMLYTSQIMDNNKED